MKWQRREDASELVLLLMIWGVVSILATRLWFVVMGNPKIAFGGWHIAHVLFGGVAMMGAILVMMIYRGERARGMAAVMGGIGWGLFIDEVGKYVTMDNNYWFRPAIIIIYVSFVLMFLLYRRLAKDEFDRGMNLKIIRQTTKIFHLTYNRIFKKKLTSIILLAYSVYFAVDKVWDGVKIVSSRERMRMLESFYGSYDFFSRSDVYMIGLKMFFDLMTALFFAGAWWWLTRRRTVMALTYFRYGLLVNILLGSVFKFYFEQFSGVFSLGLNMLIWGLLGELQKKNHQAT